MNLALEGLVPCAWYMFQIKLEYFVIRPYIYTNTCNLSTSICEQYYQEVLQD